mmetsp:Transcript_34094/g.80890  ORF Transcript_34094/g.80890 Transcript_34094/m.80890 type:complete len:303 (+) Transcript_34094:399-1307(+)
MSTSSSANAASQADCLPWSSCPSSSRLSSMLRVLYLLFCGLDEGAAMSALPEGVAGLPAPSSGRPSSSIFCRILAKAFDRCWLFMAHCLKSLLRRRDSESIFAEAPLDRTLTSGDAQSMVSTLLATTASALRGSRPRLGSTGAMLSRSPVRMNFSSSRYSGLISPWRSSSALRQCCSPSECLPHCLRRLPRRLMVSARCAAPRPALTAYHSLIARLRSISSAASGARAGSSEMRSAMPSHSMAALRSSGEVRSRISSRARSSCSASASLPISASDTASFFLTAMISSSPSACLSRRSRRQLR